jgi:hypothetical protein
LHGGAAHPVLQRVARRCTMSCRFLCSLATALRSHRLAGVALLLMLPARVAPAVLGGTTRGLSCTCAVRLVRVRITARTRRPLCVLVHAMRWCSSVRVCACVHVRFSCISVGKCFLRTCVCVWVRVCVCVCWCLRLCLGATALCGHSRSTAGTGGIYSAACDTRTAHACCVGVGHRSVRLCARRRDVDEPYDQRAMGCANWAHNRDRRRRRHLRHRRHRRRQPLPGRVGEHRRRCGPDSRGVVGG